MIPTKVDYPVFEANQVLTNEHLNSVRAYLDEQSRLTRASLNGIGIVCGLEVRAASTQNSVTITKGHGVTSEGYLAVLGTDVVADKFRRYVVPNGDRYGLLTEVQSDTLPILEILEAGEDNYESADPITSSVLSGKVVILFVELPEENLKNCSPSSCDDKGKKVTIRYRKLLIDEGALAKLNAKVKAQLEAIDAQGDFFPDLKDRLNLPDIRLPRLDFDFSLDINGPAVFAAYRSVLSKPFFDNLGNALNEAYLAFRPIIPALSSDAYLAEKLQGIYLQYDLLSTKKEIVYAQYFYDFADDLIQAYDEFRYRALALIALCNPPEALFPRHLELGELTGGYFAGYKKQRHYFRPSPAVSNEKQLGMEIRQLFRRLVLLLENFELPLAHDKIKIVPSRLGNTPLSDKAIPYYYRLTGNPSLLTTWNFRKTSTGRIPENHGYHVKTAYHREADPKADALLYDLENYNFFRIEGHIGLPWREVLSQLLKRIRESRLPFDVIALNAYPTPFLPDASTLPCICDDLQVVYDAWKKELECLLKADIKVISGLRIGDKTVAPDATGNATRTAAVSPMRIETEARASFSPKRLRSARFDILPTMITADGSLGKVLAEAIGSGTTSLANPLTLTAQVQTLLKDDKHVGNLSVSDYRLSITQPVELVGALTGFTDALPEKAVDLNYESLSKAYQQYTSVIRNYRAELVGYTPPAENPVIRPEQKDAILQMLDKLAHDCLMERLDDLGVKIQERKKQIEESLLLNKFVRQHPGLDHKAGVSKGGTFVLVFQELPVEISKDDKPSFLTHRLNGALKPGAKSTAASTATASAKAATLTLEQQKLIVDTLQGQGISVSPAVLANLTPLNPPSNLDAGFAIPERVVIADFYLPYRSVSNCPPLQFVLPPPRPIFGLTAACTDTQGNALVTFDFTRRTSPCEVRIDDEPYELLRDDRITLAVGPHKVVVRDAEGGLSLPQTIEIFPQFTAKPEAPVCNETNSAFSIRIKVTGRPPFKIDGVAVTATPDDALHTFFVMAGPHDSGTSVTYEVRDSSVCPPQSFTVQHKCNPLKPDSTNTAYNTPVAIDVLANDQGAGLKVTEASLSNPAQGKVEILEAKILSYTPAASVSNQTVTINYSATDEKGESSASIATVRVGRKPCNLPSDGETKRCAYRLWLQSGGAPYQNYQQTTAVAFVFNDKSIELPESAGLLQMPVDLLNLDFKNAVSTIIDQLNKAVNKALGEDFQRMIFTYEPSETDPFDVFWIEYFKDDAFSLGFDFNVVKGNTQTFTSVNFSNVAFQTDKPFNGATYFIHQTGKQHPIPAFGSQTRNRCDDTPFVNQCTGFDLKPAFRATGTHFKVREDMPLSGIAAWIWDVSDVNKNDYLLVGGEVFIENPFGEISKVRLTAVSEQGCVASTVIDSPVFQ